MNLSEEIPKPNENSSPDEMSESTSNALPEQHGTEKEPLIPEGFERLPNVSETKAEIPQEGDAIADIPPAAEDISLEEVNPTDLQPVSEMHHTGSLRRRRRRRSILVTSDDERSAFLNKLALKAFPSPEFFVFSLLSGAILGAGLILDSQGILLLGILLAPLMTPWVGMALASTTGMWRFFLHSLAGLLVSFLLVFGTGALAGVAARIWLPLPLLQANINSHMWWPNIAIVILGAVLLTISFARSEEKPILPSIMLAYGIFLPLSTGGFGLGAGLERIWPDGLLVFLAHLTLAAFLSIVTLVLLKFRPQKTAGYLLGIMVSLVSLVGIFVLSGLANEFFHLQPSPTPTMTATTEPTAFIPTQNSTSTPIPPTPTPTKTREATSTPTATNTLEPTPFYAWIFTTWGGGALFYTEPNGEVISSLENGTLVEILPETQTVDEVVWVHIRVPETGQVGWIRQVLLVTATPPPALP